MSIVVPKFKQSVIDIIEKSLQANTVRYYAFAANPVEYQGSIPNNTYDTANAALIVGQTMMFGKKLSNNNIAPMINNTPWAANTVFAMYDQTNTSISNSNFYCITPPSEVSGTYNVFKCLYNNNNSRSLRNTCNKKTTDKIRRKNAKQICARNCLSMVTSC